MLHLTKTCVKLSVGLKASERGRGKKREIPGADFEGGEEVMLMLCLHLSFFPLSLSLFLYRPFVATAPIICQSSVLLFTSLLFKTMMSTSKEALTEMETDIQLSTQEFGLVRRCFRLQTDDMF